MSLSEDSHLITTQEPERIVLHDHFRPKRLRPPLAVADDPRTIGSQYVRGSHLQGLWTDDMPYGFIAKILRPPLTSVTRVKGAANLKSHGRALEAKGEYCSQGRGALPSGRLV